MHLALGLSSLLLVLLAGALALRLVRGVMGWSHRRQLQLLALAMPLAGLGLSLAGLHHFSGRDCFLTAPRWDYALGMALPLAMAVIALGGLGLGVLRLFLMNRVMGQRGLQAPADVQTLVDELAQRHGLARVPVFLYPYERPLALTWGVRRPAILLSTWIIEHLDSRELQAVLAHELGHVARRDYLVIWLATVLRDAFFYLPTSCTAHRLLQYEKELACDDLTVRITRRPMALASALAKVWQDAVGQPPFSGVPAFADAGGLVEGRIERLLNAPSSTTAASPPAPCVLSGVVLGAILPFALLQALNVTLLLTLMGCAPIALLQGVFS